MIIVTMTEKNVVILGISFQISLKSLSCRLLQRFDSPRRTKGSCCRETEFRHASNTDSVLIGSESFISFKIAASPSIKSLTKSTPILSSADVSHNSSSPIKLRTNSFCPSKERSLSGARFFEVQIKCALPPCL